VTLSKTGVLSGSPISGGTYSVVMTVKNGTAAAVTQNYKLLVSPLAKGTVGTLHGLFERNAALNGNVGSSLQLFTTVSGAYTAKVITGATSTSLKGVMTATLDEPSNARIVLTGQKFGTLTNLTLTLNIDGANNRLTGTLSDGTNTASVEAWRQIWTEVPGNAASVKGVHSFYLEAEDSSVGVPQGYGFGTITVTEKDGRMAISGVLPDGGKYTGTGFVGPLGEVLMYYPFYNNLGSFIGKLTISTDGTHVVGGTMTWNKPNQGVTSKDTIYHDGFGPVEVTAVGSSYVAPASGAIVLGLSVGTENGQLSFVDGGLDGNGFTQNVTIGVTNKATFSLTNPNQVKLGTVTAASGAIGGDFTLVVGAVTRKVLYVGQIVKVDGVSRGYGYFLLPKLPTGTEKVETTPKLSGKVVLDASTH